MWRVLEGGFECVLANATAVRNMPSRNGDVNDTFLEAIVAGERNPAKLADLASEHARASPARDRCASDGDRRDRRLHDDGARRVFSSGHPRLTTIPGVSTQAQGHARPIRVVGDSQAWVLLRARFLQLKARRVPMKAIVAVAEKLLASIYLIIRDKAESRGTGASW